MANAILKLPAVKQKTQLSRSSIYRLEALGQFPKRVRLCPGGAATGWLEHEIDEWLENLPRVSDACKSA
jgi:Predicted transcriptional regulator